MPSRRELLGAAALPVLGQQQADPQLLAADDLKLVARLCDYIIPRTDTPGASDAGVQHHVHRALKSRTPRQVKAFRSGLKKFERLDDSRAIALLQTMSAKKDPFFKSLKDMTIDGYYATREGLAQDLGWQGYTPMHEFKGCTHPEHQG
ncbi:MAG: gluconate 2-dehydrogenase subunit 3 family protein [Acidobacteria bacterium]|nr:gluconate 2-dehydrogenase subunit 3 family protein [Acidobacteriota bacterium]